MFVDLAFFFYRCGDHRYLHVLAHSFPTRRASDLQRGLLNILLRQLVHNIESHLNQLLLARIEGEGRSAEHTPELQPLIRNSYAVFCMKKKKTIIPNY